MPKKLLTATFLSVLLVMGCSSTQKRAQTTESTKALAEFIAPSGKISVEFDTKGNWQSLTAVATAAVTGTSQEAREQAASVALLRARRNISEFMNGDINSKRNVSVITKTLQKANKSSLIVDNQQPISLSKEELNSLDAELSGQSKNTSNQSDDSAQISTVVREQITQNSSAILKGLIQKGQTFDKDLNVVRVELFVDRRLIDAASQMRREMIK